MSLRKIRRIVAKSSLFISLGLILFVLAGCGSTASGASSTASSAPATATACAQATRPATATRAATGTLKSIDGQTLVIATQQGRDVNVTYTSSTRFSQETTVAASMLKSGTPVRVTVTSNSGTYDAVLVTVVSSSGTNSGTGGFGGFPRRNGTPGTGGANNPCARIRFGGTPGANTTTFRGLNGTVSQLSGNVLTITDTTGADYTVTITSQTQIVETKSANAAALKVGQPLTVVGTANSQGTITATTVLILLSLPRRAAGTPTPQQ
jgi:hypothetical protein